MPLDAQDLNQPGHPVVGVAHRSRVEAAHARQDGLGHSLGTQAGAHDGVEGQIPLRVSRGPHAHEGTATSMRSGREIGRMALDEVDEQEERAPLLAAQPGVDDALGLACAVVAAGPDGLESPPEPLAQPAAELSMAGGVELGELLEAGIEAGCLARPDIGRHAPGGVAGLPQHLGQQPLALGSDNRGRALRCLLGRLAKAEPSGELAAEQPDVGGQRPACRRAHALDGQPPLREAGNGGAGAGRGAKRLDRVGS